MWNKNFILLWIGQAISQIGNRIYLMALVWYMVSVLDSPEHVMGLFIVSSLPSLLFGMFVGPLVERWNKKHIIIAADVLSGILTALLAAMVATSNASVWLFYLICFMLNVINLFFSPSINSILPTIMAKENYRQGTSMMKMMTFVSQIMGAAVGGVLVGFLGVFWSIAINAASFALSALMSAGVSYTPVIRHIAGHYVKDIREGFSYLRQNPVLRHTLSSAIFINLFVPSFLVTIPIIIKQELHLDALHYGFADAAIPIGAVIVSILLAARSKVVQNPLRVIAYSITGIALMYFVISGWQSFASVMIAALSFGFLTSYVNIQVLTYTMQTVQPDYRGRIFSLLESMSYASMSFSYLIAAILSSNLNIYAVLLVNGICLLLIAAKVLIAARKVLST